jgi:NitT/TauT family transport system permease protein
MRYIKGFIILGVVLLLWIFFSQYTNPLFLPKPSKVYMSFVELLGNGMLLKSLGTSFVRIALATLISGLISIPLGLLVANYKGIGEIITPTMGLMRYIPVTVFYPLLIMWLGIGEEMKVAFLFIATFFYFLPSVVLCIKETNQDLIDTAYTMGMNKFQVMYKVLLPYSLPSICQSFLMMYGIGWTYVIIVEVVNANSGLGHMINMGSARGRTDLVFVALFTILLISWLFDYIGNALIKKLFVWKFSREVGD